MFLHFPVPKFLFFEACPNPVWRGWEGGDKNLIKNLGSAGPADGTQSEPLSRVKILSCN